MEILFCVASTLVVYVSMVYILTAINNMNLKNFFGMVDFTEGLGSWPILIFWNLFSDDWVQKITNIFILILAISSLVWIWQPFSHPFATISMFLLTAAISFIAWLAYELWDI
jgi:hypothetical protein